MAKSKTKVKKPKVIDMEKRELQKQYNSLAKKANNRMNRWTQDITKSPAYQMVESFKSTNFTETKRDKKYSRNKQTRFATIDINRPRTKMGRMSKKELEQGINIMKRFLESKTSTQTGYKKAVSKRVRDIKKRYPGLSTSAAENLLNWLGSEQGRNAKGMFDSNQMRTAMAAHLKKNANADPFSAFSKNILNSGRTLADWYRNNGEVFGRL